MFETPSVQDGSPSAKQRVKLTAISSHAFEHPADRAALTALRKVPGFDIALRKLIGLLGERSLRTIYLASAVQVNDKQFPRLAGLWRECLETLDVPEQPDLFVAQTPFVNAGAVGVEHPFVVVNSATLALLNEEEMRFILGHELGHILADHVLFKTMLMLLLRLSAGNFGIPFGGLAVFAIVASLLEWDRKSELSCDRAGLLCCQNPAVCFRVFMKLAGGSQVGEMNIDEFMRQADEYRSGGTSVDSIHKLLNLIGQQHPFHVLRLAELRQWDEQGEYGRILAGTYPRRGTEEQASVREEFVKSAQTYRKAYQESPDPLVQFLKDFGRQAKEKGSKVWSKIKDEFENADRTRKK